MPPTATLPLPASPAHGAGVARKQERSARPRSNPRTPSMEERTAALEFRLEVLVPTLATKADLTNLENRLIRWGLVAAIGLAAVFTALFTHSATRMDNALAANTARTDNAIAELKAETQAIHARIDRLETRMDRLDARIDRLDEKIDARFDALMAEIRALGRAQ